MVIRTICKIAPLVLWSIYPDIYDNHIALLALCTSFLWLPQRGNLIVESDIGSNGASEKRFDRWLDFYERTAAQWTTIFSVR